MVKLMTRFTMPNPKAAEVSPMPDSKGMKTMIKSGIESGVCMRTAAVAKKEWMESGFWVDFLIATKKKMAKTACAKRVSVETSTRYSAITS